MGSASLCVVPVLIKLSRRCAIQDIDPEWLENFSPASYYPMQRLLSEEDFRFLARQPGFDLSLYRKLRRDRLHIFRQYLSRLILDFNRLHVTARFLLANGREDHSDLVSQLIWLKVRFSLAVIQAEASYLLCCVGFRTLGGSSDDPAARGDEFAVEFYFRDSTGLSLHSLASSRQSFFNSGLAFS